VTHRRAWASSGLRQCLPYAHFPLHPLIVNISGEYSYSQHPISTGLHFTDSGSHGSKLLFKTEHVPTFFLSLFSKQSRAAYLAFPLFGYKKSLSDDLKYMKHVQNYMQILHHFLSKAIQGFWYLQGIL
jgi:hypothetical protein